MSHKNPSSLPVFEKSEGNKGGIILAFFAGFSSFLPIGMVYLSMLTLLAYLVIQGSLRSRLLCIRDDKFLQLALVAFLIVPLLSPIWHGHYDQTDTRIFHTIRVVAVIIVGLSLNDFERRSFLLGILGGSAFVLITIWVDRYFYKIPLIKPFEDILIVTGNAGSQKMIMLACVSSFLFWLGLTSENKSRLAYFSIALITATTIIFHGISRNAYTLLAILPAAALVYRFRSIKGLLLSVSIMIAIVATVMATSKTVQDRVSLAVSETKNYVNTGVYQSSVDVRAEMMRFTISKMLEYPITGTGTGSWLLYWKDHASANPSVAGINNPHNDYLLAGMENGIPGLLSIVFLLLYFAIRNWKAKNKFGGIAFIMTVAIAFSALVNAPFRDATLGMSLIFAMAAFTRPPATVTTRYTPPPPSPAACRRGRGRPCA
jgi:O-antigen ligase